MSNTNFHIRKCPLCNSNLLMRFGGEGASYYCNKDQIYDHSYEVEHKDNVTEQKIRLYPYIIKTIAGTGRTKIYSAKSENYNTFIMDIPIITPESKETFLKKITLLIAFS